MADWSIRRGVASVAKLVELAAERGLTRRACLDGSRIDAAMLADPAAEIEAHQELTVVRNLVRALGDEPGLGIAAGRRYRVTDYGIWGYALLASQTLRSATRLGLRYLDLTFAFARFRAREDLHELCVVLDDDEVPADCRRFLVERDLAAAVMLQRDLFLGAAPHSRITLRSERPRDPSAFADFFACPLRFGAAENLIAVDTALADRPLPQANPATAALCEQQCSVLLAGRRSRAGLGERVRQCLLRPGAASLDAVAARLGVAPRTMRRRLAAEGTSFRVLQDEVREGLAVEMLRRRMSVEEVAERVGYAEPASFVHAFKRWKGVPPGVYRRHLDGAHDGERTRPAGLTGRTAGPRPRA